MEIFLTHHENIFCGNFSAYMQIFLKYLFTFTVPNNKYMNDFIKEGVKVGDRLYSITYGWGIVRDVESEMLGAFNCPITVDFKRVRVNITRDGKLTTVDTNQSVFWDEPKFEIPQKPKRDVQIKEKYFINYYPNRDTPTSRIALHSTQEMAEMAAALECQHVAILAEITFTILE